MGVRISGCAGLEIIAMLKGNHHGYLSNLSPWDYAAGLVLLEEFGFKYSGITGKPLTLRVVNTLLQQLLKPMMKYLPDI